MKPIEINGYTDTFNLKDIRYCIKKNNELFNFVVWNKKAYREHNKRVSEKWHKVKLIIEEVKDES